MYGNQFYRSQYNIDNINNQIAELERLKAQIPQQMQQPANINQTFQLAPTNQNGIKYANSIDEVNKEIIYCDTPFFSKDFSVLWIKNVKGEVKSYELNEIIQKDDKDILIENLQYQVKELRKEIENAKPINYNYDEPNSSKKSPSISNARTGKKE